MPRKIFLHGYCFNWTYVEAKTAPLAGYVVNFKIPDGMETAQFLAQSTLRAFIRIDVGYLPAPELVVLFQGRAEQQMEDSRVHITVGQHLSPCQSRQRADNAGLSSSAFTA
jgi:hypothetical protein